MAHHQASENQKDEFQRFAVRGESSLSLDRNHGVCLRIRMEMNEHDQNSDQLELLVLSLVN